MHTHISKSSKVDIVFTEGPLAGPIIRFTLPIIAAGVLQLLFNAADTIVVGRYAGYNSLAAVGSTSSLVNLILNLLIGLSVGANIVVAQGLGAGDRRSVQKSVSTSMITAVVGGIIMGIIGIVFAGPILGLMASPSDVRPLSELYLRIFFLGTPFMALFNFSSAILRAAGDTKRPLLYLSLSGVVNVLLNLIFVIVFRLDVAGVALATIISQMMSAFLVINALIRYEGYIRLRLKALVFDKNSFIKIAKIGLPSGFQGTVFSLSNIVIQSTVNTFGSVVIAGNSAAASVEGFVYMAMNSFQQTCQTFIGQNHGARKEDRIGAAFRYCLIFVTITGLVMGISAFLLADKILGIYATEAEVIHAGIRRLGIISTMYFLCGEMDTAVGALRGLGHALIPMVVSLVGACALRLLWIAFIFPLRPDITTVYVSYPVSWSITLCAHLIYWFVLKKMRREKGGT